MEAKVELENARKPARESLGPGNEEKTMETVRREQYPVSDEEINAHAAAVLRKAEWTTPFLHKNWQEMQNFSLSKDFQDEMQTASILSLDKRAKNEDRRLKIEKERIFINIQRFESDTDHCDIIVNITKIRVEMSERRMEQ